jgi:hypothetical protein
MLVGDLSAVKRDLINSTLFTKKREEKYFGGKRFCVFSYCNSFGQITNSKGILDKHCGKSIRCLQFDGKGTCYFEKLNRLKYQTHICSNNSEVLIQKKLDQLKKPHALNEEEDKSKAEHLYLSLISKSNISISSAVSPPFWQFIHWCMKAYKSSNYENPEEFICIKKRTDVSKKIIKKGTEILNSKLEEYSKHYASIQVDGFSKRQRKIKAYIISFPQFSGKNEVIKIKNMKNSQEYFSKSGAEVIEYLQSKNINISTVNCDGYGFFFLFLFFLKNSFSM